MFTYQTKQQLRLTSKQIEANAKRVNDLYGGFSPNVTNVYITHGQLDPWRAMGRQTDLNSEAPAVIIPCKFLFLKSKVL